MEKNESSSDDEDFSSDSEEFSDFSPMSSMVIVPQEGKKAVDVILEKSNKLGNSVKKREKSVIKKKIDQKNDQGEKEVLSRELMNIYRKDCMMGVPFLRFDFSFFFFDFFGPNMRFSHTFFFVALGLPLFLKLYSQMIFHMIDTS